jgi:predicted transcriptional regulator
MPEYQKLYATLKEKYESLVADTENEYNRVIEAVAGDSAAFVKEAQKNKYKKALFAMKAKGGKGSARAHYAGVPVKVLMTLLG